jgi:hypothetical protein
MRYLYLTFGLLIGAALCLALAGCSPLLPTPKAPDLQKAPDATPVSMQQTNADLARLREGLATTVKTIQGATAKAWDWLQQVPEGPTKEGLRRAVSTVEQQAAKQETLLPDLDAAQQQLAAQAKGAQALAKQNASLKSESFRWLNWTVLPAGVLALIASAVLAGYGLSWFAKGLGIGGAAAVLIAMFLPSLALLTQFVVWGVAALALLGIGYLLWSHRKALAEVVPAVQDLKEELPDALRQKWFTGRLPGMSVYQSDSTQAIVKALKPAKQEPACPLCGKRNCSHVPDSPEQCPSCGGPLYVTWQAVRVCRCGYRSDATAKPPEAQPPQAQ